MTEDINKINRLNACKILIVDDDEDIWTLYQYKLKKLCCEAFWAQTDKQAISIYQQHLNQDNAFDAVIMDLSLSGCTKNGVEITAEIHQLDPHAKVIVASGHSESDEMIMYKNYGFQASLEKNFNLATIKSVLESVIT